MKNTKELKEINIKNRVCYYFDDIINGADINFSDILLDEILYENVSVYDILHKTSTGPKPLRIRFDQIDGFVMVHDGKIKHLVLFDYGLLDKICNNLKVKKVLLQIVLIKILEGSEFIHIILHVLISLHINYSLSQLLRKIKIASIIYF